MNTSKHKHLLEAYSEPQDLVGDDFPRIRQTRTSTEAISKEPGPAQSRNVSPKLQILLTKRRRLAGKIKRESCARRRLKSRTLFPSYAAIQIVSRALYGWPLYMKHRSYPRCMRARRTGPRMCARPLLALRPGSSHDGAHCRPEQGAAPRTRSGA